VNAERRVHPQVQAFADWLWEYWQAHRPVDGRVTEEMFTVWQGKADQMGLVLHCDGECKVKLQ
jgi:hypothetical protein